MVVVVVVGLVVVVVVVLVLVRGHFGSSSGLGLNGREHPPGCSKMASSLVVRSRYALAARLGFAYRRAKSTLSGDPALPHVCDALKALGHSLAPSEQNAAATNLLSARPAVQDISAFFCFTGDPR